ncbi:MAG: hypothetical protein RL154_787, partial [Pseudomonadota bacterium]
MAHYSIEDFLNDTTRGTNTASDTGVTEPVGSNSTDANASTGGSTGADGKQTNSTGDASGLGDVA